ncbi:MAG: response regulator transcription factor [Armatimonadota bacterium]
MSRILIIEDERPIAQSLAYTLKREGFEVIIAGDGAEGLQLALDTPPPSLIILDLMLPSMDGLEVCRTLRQRQSHWIPVLMLTAKAEEIDRVIGLEIGADDYLTKPFSMRELVARVKATLRRPMMEMPPETVLAYGGVSVDIERHSAVVDGRPIVLSPKEFEMLAVLLRNQGRAMSRDEILSTVWGDEGPYRDPHTVDVHVRWLREKIETDPANPTRLLTIRGIGYKFAE